MLYEEEKKNSTYIEFLVFKPKLSLASAIT